MRADALCSSLRVRDRRVRQQLPWPTAIAVDTKNLGVLLAIFRVEHSSRFNRNVAVHLDLGRPVVAVASADFHHASIR